MPRVSVVIPLYNKDPHIAQTIQSVLNQTEQNFEIIVVDGQSTDEGPKVVKSFKDQRIFFFEQEGSGVSSARNEGSATLNQISSRSSMPMMNGCLTTLRRCYGYAMRIRKQARIQPRTS